MLSCNLAVDALPLGAQLLGYSYNVTQRHAGIATMRISSVAVHPSTVNQSDTVANQLNPMPGAFSESDISSSS